MDKAHNETDKILARIEKNIKEVYNETLKELRKELSKITSEISNSDDPKKIYRQLQNKKRLEQRIVKMTNILQNSNQVAIAFLNDDLAEVYALNYNWGAYTVETASLFDVDYTLYNINAIKEILKENANPFMLVAVNELKDKGNIYRELKSQLTRALMKGESIKEIATRIAKVTNKNMNDSLRIAQTETTRIENLGRLDSFKYAEKQGLKLKKSWLATMDKRTRESHQKINQEEVDLDKTFSNGLMYPGDPNGRAEEVIRCRCAMTSEFAGFEKTNNEKKLDERLRNMSFEEWQKERR